MSLVKVKKFAQVTIPANIRHKAHIEEGDYVATLGWLAEEQAGLLAEFSKD